MLPAHFGEDGLRRAALLFVLALSLLAATAAAAVAGTAYLLHRELRSSLEGLRQLEERHGFETTRIYDRDGELLYEIFEVGRRRFVPLREIPETLVLATLAAEDGSFWTNPGFDPRAVARAAYQNLRHGRIVSGGSTITQQLVRTVIMTPQEARQRTVRRKVKEIALSFLVTQTLGKRQVLETYLNQIYYGNLAYGAQAAAQAYFGKDVAELSLGQAALLAGLPQSPALHDPFQDPDSARERQAYVLRRMTEEGFIGSQEAQAAADAPLSLAERQDAGRLAPHFVEFVRAQLETELGPKLVRQGGLDVHTTLDLQLQEAVQATVAEGIAAVREAHHATNGAALVLQPTTGHVLAMVGSADFEDESIDGQVNVVLRLRQPGSSIKPITYAGALETGYTPAHVLQDAPTVIQLAHGPTYEPRNYDQRFHGPVRMRTALANSYNIPAVKMLQEIGIPRFLEQAHAMGIRGLDGDPSSYGPSITLGGGEVTLLGSATAYSTLANLGRRVDPVAILRVERHGQVLQEWTEPQPDQAVMDPRTAYILSDILADDRARLPAFGQGNPLDLPFTAAAKTGTTDSFRDNWTLGYTPRVTVGVWVGNSDNSPMVDSSGVTGAAPIWHEVMLLLHQDPALADLLVGPEWPQRPEGLVEREICDGILGCWVELFFQENQEVEPLAPQQARGADDAQETKKREEKEKEREESGKKRGGGKKRGRGH